MADDNRWNDRDRDWRDDRSWHEGRGRERAGYETRPGGAEERWRRMHEDRTHEGAAGYNDSGPIQGGWSFGDPEQGGERGQGYERYGYGRGPERSLQGGRDPGVGSGYGDTWGAGRSHGRRGGQQQHSDRPYYDQPRGGAFGQPEYGQGPYTPYGYQGRNEYDHRGRGGYGAEGGERRGGEDRSWLERAGDRVAHFFGADEEGAPHRGRGPRGYRRSDDRIREDVNDRLTDDPWLDASNIDVEVSGAEVTLSGTVNSRDDKRRAENLAESISGVTHVQNNLRAKQPDQDKATGLGVTTDPSSSGL